MRKDILLMIFFATILAVSFGFVSADVAVNRSVVSLGSLALVSNNTNYTGSVIFNITIQNLSDMEMNMTVFNASGPVINVSWWGLSSNGSNLRFASNIQQCVAGVNSTSFHCWKNVTLNSSVDGLWTIWANITTNNGTFQAGIFRSHASLNISAILFDSSPPNLVTIVTPATAGINRSNALFLINVSVKENTTNNYNWNSSSGMFGGGVFFNITNNLGGLMNVSYHIPSTGNGSNVSGYDYWYQVNTSHLTTGTFTITVWANDSLNNINNTKTITMVVDLGTPTITGTKNVNSTQTRLNIDLTLDGSYSGLNGVCTTDRTGDAVTGTFLGTLAKTQYISESSLACSHSYSYAVTCTSYAGNVGTATVTASTNGCQGAAAPGTTTGGTAWTMTYVVTETQLSEGYVKEMPSNTRVEVSVGGGTHHVGVKSVSATSATIEVSSTPQTATLNIGDTKRFDVTSDGYYDLSVTLNSITAGKADLLVNQITEDIAVVPEPTTGETPETGETTPTIQSLTTGWIIGVIVVILVIIIAVVLVKGKKKKR